MMSMAEIQLLTYANAILRQRGYADAADRLADVVAHESDSQTHDERPAHRHLRAVS